MRACCVCVLCVHACACAHQQRQQQLYGTGRMLWEIQQHTRDRLVAACGSRVQRCSIGRVHVLAFLLQILGPSVPHLINEAAVGMVVARRR